MILSITSVCRRVVSSSTMKTSAHYVVVPFSLFSSSSSASTTSSATTGGGGCPTIPSAYVALQQSLENSSNNYNNASSSNNSDERQQHRRSSNDDPATLRLRALSLYKQLLRAARRMPTPNRTNYIITKTRDEYRKHSKLVNKEEIEFQLRLADTNLDTVLVQAEHLSRLFRDPEYQNYN